MNEKQCQDILDALREEYIFSIENKYEKLMNAVKHRLIDEFFDYYMAYVARNSEKVCHSFMELIKVLDTETQEILLKKVFMYISTQFVIPYRKVMNNNTPLVNAESENKKLMKKIEETRAKLSVAQNEWNQARFEVDSIRSSFSYKLGLFFTFIPRKVRALFARKKS